MPAFNIAVVDEGGALSPGASAVLDFVQAADEYVSKWLAAFWPEVAGSAVRIATAGNPVPDGWVPLVLAPNTTEANSLGYHDETPAGLPTGIVELDACRSYNVPWTVTATHELGELLINPKLDRFASVGTRFYPVEIADPVTGDSFMIGNIAVSNFSTPAFWDPVRPSGPVRFDAMELVTSPLPAIPHNGWLEWAEGGAYSSAYGAALTPELVQYMHAKKGRRHRLALRQRNGLWGRTAA